MKFGEMFNKVGDFGKKNNSAILAGLGVVGLIATGYFAYKAGAKADRILEEKRKDMALVDPKDKEAKKAVSTETAKALAPILAPPIVMGIASTACIIGSHKASQRKIAALSAAYSIAETSIKELNGKMRETLGEQKTRQIKDAITKDKLNANPPVENNIILPENGDIMCKDSYSGRFFRSNAQKIGLAINKMSGRIATEMYVSLNDFYDAINSSDLPPIPMGEDLGWNIDDLYNGALPITYTAILTDSGIPCLCLDYDISLRADFKNLH